MKITNDLLFLPRTEVELFFAKNIANSYNVIKQTYLDFTLGKSKNPPSNFLWYDELSNSRIIALPAYLGDKKCPGIKWISSCPNNIENNLPRASSLIILNDFITGFPVAVMEGATISALRTALSAILALEYLNLTRHIPVLGIIGCGNLAKVFLQCLQTLGFSIESCYIYDKSISQRESFEKVIAITQINLLHTDNLEQVLLNSDVVLFATTEVKPYIHNINAFKPDATVLHLSLRDLSPEIILSAFNIVDDIEHVLQANTSPHLAFLKTNQKSFIAGSISQLINNMLNVSFDRLKIFSPMGMGILDIALANLILENNMDQNRFTINGFFS